MEYLAAKFNIDCPKGLLQTARDLLADGVSEAGFESFEDTDNGLTGYVQKCLFDKAALDMALKEFPLENTTVSYTVVPVEDKDWNAAWEQAGFEPVSLTSDTSSQGFTIAPYALYNSKQWDAHTIFIDAKQAFGTGTHETTQMMVATLLPIDLKGKTVLDCGCGTGILGIAASKLGAKDVTGYDIDEWSVNNARHNAELNGVGNMTICHGDASVIASLGKHFDIVLANINRNILLNDMQRMTQVLNQGGLYIISGFYTEDLPMLADKAEALGLRLKGKRSNNHWCSAVFIKA